MSISLPIELQAKYERSKKIEVLDNRVFKICEIKEKEIGLLKRRLMYIHFDGKKWNLLLTNYDLSKVKLFQLE